MVEGIKLIIFDMDGVLVDSCDWHYIALNKALKEVCGYLIPEDDHHNKFNGLPTRVKLKHLCDVGIIKENQIDIIEGLKQKKTIETINSLAIVKPEKIELLKYIKSRNLKTACYTNCIRASAELILYKIGVLDYLDKVVTNQDVTLAKPNPEGYISCMSYFGVTPKESIVVEDSVKGIEAATLSGAHVIVVKNSHEVTTNKIIEILS